MGLSLRDTLTQLLLFDAGIHFNKDDDSDSY